jgi:hypothetical protein
MLHYATLYYVALYYTILYYTTLYYTILGALRHCATSRKVPGSIPGGVTENFFRGIRQFHVTGVDSAS